MKTSRHAAVQKHLRQQLGSRAHLEYPFPEIGRIADLYWEPEALIFEVQVSPITPDEVCSRIEDYSKLGLAVVWILHDKQFNRRIVSPAERALRGHPYYYTNIDERGGIIYDVVKLARNDRVKKRAQKLPITPEQPMRKARVTLPVALATRSRGLYFSGDALDQLSSNPYAWDAFDPRKKRARRNPYRLLLDRLIETLADSV